MGVNRIIDLIGGRGVGRALLTHSLTTSVEFINICFLRNNGEIDRTLPNSSLSYADK